MNIIAASGVTVPPATDKPLGLLVKRLASAIVLGSTALACVWLGGAAFAALIVAVALLMCWEWDRLTGGDGRSWTVFLLGAIVVAVCVLAAVGWPEVALAVALAGALAVALIARLVARPPGWALLGVPYIVLPCVAVIWLRGVAGFEVVIWLLAVVWATDSGAYVFGRAIGGPKLAPRISPKKTWAGLIGGMTVAAAAGWLLALAFAIGQPTLLAIAAAVLAVVGQAGDLTESAIKRHFQVKDSSNLIPGHGGVLDRVDGLLFAAPLWAMVWAMVSDMVSDMVLVGGGEGMLWR